MPKIIINVNGGDKEFIAKKANNTFSVIVSNEPRDETRYEVPTAWLENENNIKILKGKHTLAKVGELYE